MWPPCSLVHCKGILYNSLHLSYYNLSLSVVHNARLMIVTSLTATVHICWVSGVLVPPPMEGESGFTHTSFFVHDSDFLRLHPTCNSESNGIVHINNVHE